MENNWLTNNRKTLGKVLLFAAAFWFVYTVRKDLVGTLMPFLYASIFAYLLNPFINFLQRKGIRRGWSAFLTVLIIFALMVFLVVLFIPSLIRDASVMIRTLSGGVKNLQALLDDSISWLQDTLGTTVDMDSEINSLSQQGIRLISDTLTRLVSSIGGLVDVLLIPVISFYLLKDKDHIFQEAALLLPPASRPKAKELGRNIQNLLSGYVKGKLLISTMIGLITGLGCLLIGLPNALTIGIVAGAFDLIPYFGPWLGGILPVIIALIGPTPFKAVWVILLILVVQQVESNLITPRIISQSVGLHPLLVMFSVMFFGAIFGIPGMILGVPIMAVLLALLRHARPPLPGTPAAEPQPAPSPPPATNVEQED